MVDLYRGTVAVPKLAYDYIKAIGPEAAGNIITVHVEEELEKIIAELEPVQEEDSNVIFNWVHDTVLSILASGPRSRTDVINELIFIKKRNKVKLGGIAGYKFYAQVMDTMRFAGELEATGSGTGTRWIIA